jgi:hypothetical protein
MATPQLTEAPSPAALAREQAIRFVRERFGIEVKRCYYHGEEHPDVDDVLEVHQRVPNGTTWIITYNDCTNVTNWTLFEALVTLATETAKLNRRRARWREYKRRKRDQLRTDVRQTSIYGEGHTRELRGMDHDNAGGRD